MRVDLNVCECCGHPLPSLEYETGLTPMQRRIFVALHKAGQGGVTLQSLIDRVYANCSDGGPLTAQNSMHVQRHYMQKRLAPFGMKITTSRGHGSIWRLEKLSKTERSTQPAEAIRAQA